jgi:xanthine dehydrogenase YagS FAD-binding subunit
MPGVSIVDGRVKENSLRYNEIITQINVPAPASGTVSSFFRMTDRGAVDFPLASAAVVANTSGSTISSSKVVLGHVANKPIRSSSAESAINGQSLPLSESVIAQAAQNALSGATPLTHPATSAAGPGQGNGFRVYIAKGVLTNALRALSA